VDEGKSKASFDLIMTAIVLNTSAGSSRLKYYAIGCSKWQKKLSFYHAHGSVIEAFCFN
jgi:hypothetical protein